MCRSKDLLGWGGFFIGRVCMQNLQNAEKSDNKRIRVFYLLYFIFALLKTKREP